MTDNAKSPILSKNVSSCIGLERSLRLPGIVGDYMHKKLKDIAKKIQRKDQNSIAPIMMLSAGAGFINQSEKYSRDNAGQSLAKYTVLNKGELAYNHGASKQKPFGCCYMLTEESARIPYVYHCFAIPDNSPSYVATLLNNRRLERQLKKLISSSVRMDGLLNISYEEYMSVDIFLPSLAEQQKISDFMSLVDEQNEKQRQLVEVLKRYKRGLFYSIYSAKQLNWKSVCLGDFSKVYGGYAFDSKSYSESGKYKVLTIGSVSGNRYADIDSCNMVDEIPADIQQYQILHPNDLVISMTGNVGRVSIVNQLDCLLNQRVAKLDITDSTIREYVYQVLSCSNFEQEMNNVGQGAAQKNIKNTDIEHFGFYIPNNEIELLTVVGLLCGIDNTILKQEQILTKLANSKQALLQQMFI